jgi:haloalkane dehalogenase
MMTLATSRIWAGVILTLSALIASVATAESANVGTEAAYKLPRPAISEVHGIQGQSVRVLDSTMYYLEVGEGAPIVFLHGNPTSSYLWRNVMPHVSGLARAVAPDLIGMGRSGKIDSDYKYVDHYRYLSAFLDELDLDDVTFVVHDWGATLGFDYARRNPDRVKGIAFMEGVLPPIFPQPSFEAMGEELGGMFRAFKDPVMGREMVIEQNVFIEKLLPEFANRSLGTSAANAYRGPFINVSDREPLLAWPREIPIAGEPANIVTLMSDIQAFMTSSDLPFLLLYADPGVLVSPAVADWYAANMKTVETAYIGQGLHFVQEDQPFAIGRSIADWLRRIR